MVSGILTKDDYRTLKAKYTADEAILKEAITKLDAERDSVLDGSAERLRWMGHFRDFKNLRELDRRTVVNLIQSIRIVSKTELDITFNYQFEYEQVCNFLGNEAA